MVLKQSAEKKKTRTRTTEVNKRREGQARSSVPMEDIYALREGASSDGEEREERKS